MIQLKNLTKVFSTKQTDVAAVKNVQLSVDKGDIYGIIGYSGAGKSTLIRLLNGLEKPTEGEIWINGRDLTKLNQKELRLQRQKIGMIFQHFHLLWSRTVLENVLFPLEVAGVPKSERTERAQELIELVGLKGKEDAYPSQLSGGQKQRVGIARALANDPDILLCDEATSALDPETTEQILQLLVEINQRLNLTIVLITHEMAVVRKICNKVAVMDNGRVVEEGSVLDVFRYPKEEVTKKFVRQDRDNDIKQTGQVLKQLKEQFPEGKIIQLTFHGDTVQQPILSTIVKNYDVRLNIIQGSIQSTKENPLGSLLVHLEGTEDDMQRTFKELEAAEVVVDELNTGESDE